MSLGGRVAFFLGFLSFVVDHFNENFLFGEGVADGPVNVGFVGELVIGRAWELAPLQRSDVEFTNGQGENVCETQHFKFVLL